MGTYTGPETLPYHPSKCNSGKFVDEITREVFVENYVQHIEGRYGKRGNTMCITVPVEERDKRFILDSGSGHDLISSTRISRMDLPTYDGKTVNFHTANGVTSSTKR